MVLIQDRILKIDIYNFEMSYKTPEKSLKSNQIYSVVGYVIKWLGWQVRSSQWCGWPGAGTPGGMIVHTAAGGHH